MKLGKYLKDKLYFILITFFMIFIIFLLLLAFKVDNSLILALTIILIFNVFLILTLDYVRKRKFYTELLLNIKHLDKAYLVLETLDKPTFYEGELLYQALYEINKSMSENLKIREEQIKDFKEYIEMWVHEVKRPLVSLILSFNNHKENFDTKTRIRLKKLGDYVDKVLYYVRCENAAKDYYINEVELSKVIKNVGIKNMDDLLDNKIDFLVSKIEIKVYTDSKWLEFILEQIVNNSIKYKRNIKNSYIKIYTKEDLKSVTLIVEDNGKGIKASDINQVFAKTFTGVNGRSDFATGMGLFIAKNLCLKLGHTIEIESKENKYTKVLITFAKNNYYEVLK